MSLFLDAIKVIENRGWTQGTYADENGCVCLIGACTVAYGSTTGNIDSNNINVLAGKFEKTNYLAILDNILMNTENRTYYPKNSYYTVINWNDEKGRTVEEVKDVLRKAHEYECAQVTATED